MKDAIEKLVGAWIQAEEDYRKQIADEPYGSHKRKTILAVADELHVRRRQLQEAAELVVVLE